MCDEDANDGNNMAFADQINEPDDKLSDKKLIVEEVKTFVSATTPQVEPTIDENAPATR